MACGIMKFSNVLIRADKVLYAFPDDEDEKSIVVGIEGVDDDHYVCDCSLERFYDEWRRALTY